MTTNTPPGAHGTGLVATLKVALGAGLACGTGFGAFDGVVAAWTGTADLEFAALAGCLAGAVFQYSLAWCAALVVAGVALHPMLHRKGVGERLVLLLSIGLTLGFFVETYWWTRAFVFPGRSAVSTARLLATGSMLVATGLLGSFVARRLAPVLAPRSFAALALAGVVALAGALYVRGQDGTLGARGQKTRANADVPNVLLVVVDALRQDTLGCYGHPRVKSPHVDRLAREGVVFENAFTQAPFTWTSFGSLLTGKYPRRHGLMSMAPDVEMVPSITLPWHLKTACFRDDAAREGACLAPDDYLGATFHTGTLSTGSRLLRGFDVYYEQLAGHDLVVAASPWSVFRSDLLLHVFAQKLAQRAGDDTSSVARRWLQENGARRFVAMVHIYSTHTPYDPRPEFRALYADPSYAGPVKSFYAGDRIAIETGRARPTPADVEAIRNLYYAGVSEADAKIGSILSELERQGVLDDTLVIVTSDHGESLGEPSLLERAPIFEHDHMEQTNLRVPLVMRWPGHLPAARRVEALTDEIDVLPTVCDLLRIQVPSEPGEYGRVDGVSLLPLVRGERSSVREYSFAENGFSMSIQDRRFKLVVPTSLLSEKDWPRGKTAEGDAPVLFDLASDPAETRDELARQPEVVARLLAALRAWSASLPIPHTDVVLSPREREARARKLQGLGYVDGGQGSGARRASGKTHDE